MQPQHRERMLLDTILWGMLCRQLNIQRETQWGVPKLCQKPYSKSQTSLILRMDSNGFSVYEAKAMDFRGGKFYFQILSKYEGKTEFVTSYRHIDYITKFNFALPIERWYSRRPPLNFPKLTVLISLWGRRSEGCWQF